VLEATVRAAVAKACVLAPDLPLVAGGKSMGGRMTSNAMAHRSLDGVRGLVFLGFPLHPPKQPGVARGEHLARVQAPMLFLQGTRDTLADLDLITGVCERLGPQATLHVVEGADHSFSVLKRSGRTDAEVLEELADTITDWVRQV
jgi:predicted alpha/beta-hydrolase family hydrolase